MTATEPALATDAWTQQLEQLSSRYKHVRPPTLAALNVLIFAPQISVDDAKARAALRGVGIAAAGIGAAGHSRSATNADRLDYLVTMAH